MRVVDEPVENRVRHRRICKVVVPAFNRDLTCDDGRARRLAVFQNFEDVAPLLIAQRRDPWQLDPRISEKQQVGKRYYERTPLEGIALAALKRAQSAP
jgi:hypothetical protein